MLKSWPGYLPPLAAAAVTLIFTALFAAVISGSAIMGEMQGLLALLLIPVPLLVAVAWGSALLISRPFRSVLAGAVLWFVLSWLLLPHDVVWQMSGNLVAGLAAGYALARRWRLDGALAAVAVALLPLIIWSAIEMPVGEQLEAFSTEMLTALEAAQPTGGTTEQRALALADEEANLARVADLVERIYPFLLGIGLLGQGGILLALVRLVVGRLGMLVPGWKIPPFSRWRMPFYLVWMLVAGIGLMLTRMEITADAGLNLALLAAFLLSIQGTAVQWQMTSRMLSKMGRLFYWVATGLLFVPLVVMGVGLGLADQWVDLRRLGTDSDRED